MRFRYSSPGLPARGGNQPGLQYFRFLYVVQFLKESCEYVLKDLGSLIFIESSTKWNRVNETLITQYQFLPRNLLTSSAGQYQLQVTIFHLNQGFGAGPE